MSDQDLFDDDKVKDDDKPTDEPTSNPEDKGGDDKPADDNLLNLVTNEDGTPKYKTVEELAKGAAHAQEHIQNLEKELSEARSKGDPTEKLEELLDAVKSGSGNGEETSAMKPEDVLGIVKEYLTDVKAAESRDNNIKSVTGHFRDRYGKDASEKLYGKAEDLGFTKSEINRMIATNPKAAMKVLGEDMNKPKSTDPVGSSGSVDTAHFREAPKEKARSIMGHTSQKVLMDSWEASKQKTLDRLGIKLDK